MTFTFLKSNSTSLLPCLAWRRGSSLLQNVRSLGKKWWQFKIYRAPSLSGITPVRCCRKKLSSVSYIYQSLLKSPCLVHLSVHNDLFAASRPGLFSLGIFVQFFWGPKNKQKRHEKTHVFLTQEVQLPKFMKRIVGSVGCWCVDFYTCLKLPI